MDQQQCSSRSPLSTFLLNNDQHPPNPTTLISPRLSYDNLLYSPSRSSTATLYDSIPFAPTPSPSLLYHCISSLHRHDGTIFSIALSNSLVFTSSESSRIRAWRHPDCTERGYLKSSHGEIRAILAHGNSLFSSHKDFKVRVWNVTANPENNHFQAKKVANLPKKKSIFTLPIRKTTTSSGSNNNKHRDCISCMAYNHTDGLLYTGSWDRTVKAWRVSDNRCVDSFVAHEDRINGVVLNQEDGCLFSCSSDGSVKIWRRVYGQSSHTLTMTLKFQPSPVNAIALSATANSCFLYSGSSDGFINFWEKEKMSGRFNHGGFLQGHRFAVLCLAAVERLLFSGSEDTTIRVWRREEGSGFHECLAVVDAHRGPVKSVAAAMEMEKVVVMGFLVYSAGLDQTFKVWRIKVLPEEKGAATAAVVDAAAVKVGMEYEMSPVLSPSWVEKKIQAHDNPFR